MSGLELDEIDYRLLMALQNDSRISFKQLAKKANVSIPTARSRINRLTSLGIIRFTTSVDSSKIVGGVGAFITLKSKVQDLERIAESLDEVDDVDEVHITTGENDVVLKVCTPDIRSFNELLTQKLSKISGVEYIRSSIIIETKKQKYGFMVRPGFGVKIFCITCKKLISGEMVKKSVDGMDHFFCCHSCSSVFLKERGRTD